MADLTPVVGRGLLGAVKALNPCFVALGVAAVSIVTSQQTWAENPPSVRAQAQADQAEARAAEAADKGAPLAEERYADAATRFRQVASVLEEAAQVEATAAKLEQKTLELETQARRARTLVEQTETRRARALARLQELGLTPQTPLALGTPSLDDSAAEEQKTGEPGSTREQP